MDPCTLGTLASTVTGIRSQPRAEGQRQTCDRTKSFDNGLSMFRFAQRAIEQYNSTLGANVKFSGAALKHSRKAFEDLFASLGERLEPEQMQTIDGLDELVAAIEEKCALRIDASLQNISSGSIFFDDLAELYRPGTKVISSGVAGSGLMTGFTVLWSKYEEGKVITRKTARLFVLCVECWISVGQHFMPVVFTDKTYTFENRRSVSDLFFRPLQIDVDGSAVSGDADPAISEDSQHLPSSMHEESLMQR